MNETKSNSRNGILSLTIRDKAVLLTLMDEAEKIPISGRVVWVTPRGAQGNRTAGIGVQFSEQDAAANAKIENHLAGSLSSDRPTHTM